MIIERLKNDWIASKFANCYIVTSENIELLLKEVTQFISDNIFIDLTCDLENNPNYLLLGPEIVNNKEQKFINVAQARNAIEFFSKTSWLDQAKILLIYKAEKMNENCSNALLKLLEDTPQNSYVFLLTDNINQILKTIRSRARIICNNEKSEEIDEFNYLNIIIDYVDKDIEKFFKEIEAENKKSTWEAFTKELEIALHGIVVSSISNINLEKKNKLQQIIKRDNTKSLIELNDRVNYLISSCSKYDLSKKHIFYLIAEILRS